jgi:hypothetical protein
MRYPGIVLGVGEQPDPGVLGIVAAQLGVDPQAWAGYARRPETRREHLVELAAKCGFQPFTAAHHRAWVTALEDIGVATEKGVVLAGELVAGLRAAKVLLPSTAVIERVCAEALTRADRRVYAALTDPLTDAHRERLDRLLTRREDTSLTWLAWLRQSPAKPNSRHMLDHIARLRAWTELDLPEEIDRVVHRNRLARIARQGAQMTPADLARFEPPAATPPWSPKRSRAGPPSPTRSSTCTTGSSARCSTPPATSTARRSPPPGGRSTTRSASTPGSGPRWSTPNRPGQTHTPPSRR